MITVNLRAERDAESWDDCKQSAMHGNPVLFPASSFLALAKSVDELKRTVFIQQCVIDALLAERLFCIGEMK